jgi:catechol 2,3-dioxygenase-like lactoylglutathione lyase family enzyme
VRFDHAVLLAADAARTTEWYRRVLGAEVEQLHYGRVALVLGDARLHVQFPTSTPNPRPVAPAGPGASDFCLVWDGTAAEAVAHLEGHGVAIVAGPVDRQGSRGTGASVYCHDPDGNLVELISYAASE